MTAIWKTPSLHEPSSVMLFFLALTDLSVGLLLQPCYVTYLVSVLIQDPNIFDVMFLVKKRLSSLLSLMSVMTVAAVSIERYLALALHLRYDALVTCHRCIVASLAMWVAPTAFTVMSFWNAEKPWFRITASFGGFVLALSSLIAIPTIQCRIFAVLRRHLQQIQDQNNIASRIHGLPRIDIAKYRKSVFVILYVVLAAFVSYVPFGVCFAIIYFYGETQQNRLALETTLTVVFLNSSLNPFIYCWKIREIRFYVISTFRQICGLNETANNTTRSEVHRRPPASVWTLQLCLLLQTKEASPSTLSRREISFLVKVPTLRRRRSAKICVISHVSWHVLLAKMLDLKQHVSWLLIQSWESELKEPNF